MKSITHLATLLTPVFCAGLSAQAAFSLGDNVTVFVTSEAGVRYESNVLLQDSSQNEKSDTVFYYTPGIILNAGTAGVTDFNAQVMYRNKMSAYCDLHRLNTQNNDASGSFSYKDASFKVTGSASYLEAQTNTDLTGDDAANLLQPGRIDRSIYTAGAYAETSISPKTKIGTGVNYSLQDYSFKGYTDFSSISVPVDFYYSLTPKTDISLDYQYRPIYVGSGNSAEALDQTVGIGIRGDIMPKLTGNVRVGVTNRDYRSSSNNDDDSGLSFSGNLSYELSPLMTVGARLTRDYSISPSSGNTTLRTGAALISTYKMTETVSFGGNIAYYTTDYVSDNRDDKYFAGGLFASYQPNEYFNLKVGYDYNVNDSNRKTGDYNDNILQVVASFRY
jgi:polysaccharide biosynthesis protein VpsM